MNKEAVVTNVLEKPVVQNVIEKKNVEIHHKPVVQEIHEQKIIEIEKKPVLQNVHQPTLVKQERAATQFEEIGSANLSEQERLRLQQLNAPVAPKITQTGGVQQIQEREQVAQVVKQEFIERHVQPVVTEVREQNIVQEVVHPVVRKVHDAPIIREVTSSAPLQGAPLQSGLNKMTTTTTGTGLSSTTTTTTGMNPVDAERRNMNLHEQKVMHKDAPLSTAEKQNLAVHEKVVDNVVKHQTTGTQVVGTSAPVTTVAPTTTHGHHHKHHDDRHATVEGEQKPGFMERVKEKLHLGHHHNDTTTTTKH